MFVVFKFLFIFSVYLGILINATNLKDKRIIIQELKCINIQEHK